MKKFWRRKEKKKEKEENVYAVSFFLFENEEILKEEREEGEEGGKGEEKKGREGGEGGGECLACFFVCLKMKRF